VLVRVWLLDLYLLSARCTVGGTRQDEWNPENLQHHERWSAQKNNLIEMI
jgi:hypothetical protein